MLKNKRGLLLLLLLVFLVNCLETGVESKLHDRLELGAEWRHRTAEATSRLENGFEFTNHDRANVIASHGYSISYFFVLPLLMAGLAVALWFREELSPFRVFSLAIAFDYWISLPFFLLFPLPERWAHPESGAVLLSDLWHTGLIEMIRPISGLDNSFPSFHVSTSVTLVAVCYLFRLPFRHSVAALAATVVLSTFVLGIHWLPDIVAGLALGVLSVLLARRLDLQLARAERAAGTPVDDTTAAAGVTP